MIRAASKEDVFAALDKALSSDNVFEAEYTGTVRASSLPFCQRQYVLYHCTDIAAVQQTDFHSAAAMEMGTALHSVAQRFLGQAGLLYGNWKCPKCRKLHEDLQGPVSCCGESCIYEEYSLRHECGITAHPDGVCLKLPDGSDFRAIWEFKGCHPKKMAAMKQPIWRHSLFQANFYLNLVNEKKNLGLEHIVIVYVDRGVPSNRKYFIVKPNPSVYLTTIKGIREAKEKVKLRILPERICNGPNDAQELHCPYQHVCFLPDSKLEQAINGKAT